MSNEYLDLFKVGNVDCLALGNVDETDAVIRFLKDSNEVVIPRTSYQLKEPSVGMFVELADAYKEGYYVYILITATVLLPGSDQEQQITDHVPFEYISEMPVPILGDESGVIVFISDIPAGQLINNYSIIDSAFIKAYGVNFTMNEVIPLDPEDERTFITIRDNETLKEIGKAYDLMNTRIYEEINNKFTLDFNILPYYNVYRIRHPNFLELDGNYFRVRRVEKKRSSTLMMAISCEHISYELNNEYEIAAEDEDFDWPDFLFEGTPKEILSEMLQGTRFRIGTVQFNDVVQFNSKPMGFRSMIIALANEIGAEVKWDRFTISLVERRGADRDLTFEVGKNLISMTEVYETHANGAFNRFYDVDVIDLSIIEDEGVQEEMYDIRLGDTVRLIDEQFNIDIDQRVVSYEIDPFRKELPKIQLEHVMKNIANTIGDISSSVTDLKRLKGGGSGGDEKIINLINRYDSSLSASDNPDDDSTWTYLNLPNYREVVVTTNSTNLIAGLKMIGNASAPATLEGVVQMYIDGSNVLIENSRFKTSLTSGFNTISLPFAIQSLNSDTFLYLAVKMTLSNGTFEVLSGDANMYVKGRNIEIVYEQIIS